MRGLRYVNSGANMMCAFLAASAGIAGVFAGGYGLRPEIDKIFGRSSEIEVMQKQHEEELERVGKEQFEAGRQYGLKQAAGAANRAKAPARPAVKAAAGKLRTHSK